MHIGNGHRQPGAWPASVVLPPGIIRVPVPAGWRGLRLGVGPGLRVWKPESESEAGTASRYGGGLPVQWSRADHRQLESAGPEPTG